MVHRPVRVWKQWSLKTSVSSISIPELPTSGDSWEPMANNLKWKTPQVSSGGEWRGQTGRDMNLRVEHWGQHQLLVRAESCSSKADGHGIVGRFLQVLHDVLPFSCVLPNDIDSVYGEHSVAHWRETKTSTLNLGRSWTILNPQPRTKRRLLRGMLEQAHGTLFTTNNYVVECNDITMHLLTVLYTGCYILVDTRHWKNVTRHKIIIL